MKIILLLLAMLFGAEIQLFAQAVTLSPDEFAKRSSAPQAQILDVRTASEFQNAHIKNSLQADWLNFDQFKGRVQYLDKNRPVMIYCASGGRSSAAAEWLRKNGYTDVQELKGGLIAWKSGNKPTEGIPDTKQMVMEQFVQLSQSSGKVLVDFGADWCPPCKKMNPVLSQAQQELKSAFKLVKVDAGIHTDIMKKLHIEAIPTFIIYENGKETWRQEGVVELAELKKQLGK